jgi:GLPGLI family protein
MKYSNFIFSIFLFFSQISVSQEKSGVIYYGHKIGEIAIDTSSIKNNGVKNVILNQYLQKKEILSGDVNVYKLIFDNNKSLFEPIKKLDNDANPSYVQAVPNDKYYTDLVKKEILKITNFSGKDFIVEQNNNLVWNITKREKYINDFKCYMATVIIENGIGVKTKVTAWFTKEILLNLGPREYSGLPGLIMELQLRENVYYFKDIKFENLSVNDNFKGKRLSNKSYQELFKNIDF